MAGFDRLVPQFKSSFERNDDELIASIPGRYAITEARSHNIERLPVFACRLCSISPQGAVIKAPVLGFDGERVSVYFNEFGILPGRVSRCLPEGFAVTFELGQAERSKLAARIQWQKRHGEGEVVETRDFERIVPKRSSSILTLPSGEQHDCTVTDISRSGAALVAPCQPDIGTPLALGRLLGRVVRHTENGFALQFLKIQEADRLGELLLPCPAKVG